MTTDDGWLEQRERGSVRLVRFMVVLARFCGRRPTRPLAALIALWYRLFDRTAVRASRAWLTRVHGHAPGFWAVYRHLETFVQVTIDRIFLLSGELDTFEFTRTGRENLQAQVATGRGAILLGAHLGSYEAMRASGATEGVPINILGFFKNAAQINAVLSALNAGAAARVIHIGDDPMSSTLKAKSSIERGELVAILGDRVGINDKVVKASFFGEDAYFPTGPFLLASLLRCPVYFVAGLYERPNRYHLHCLPFADSLDLPRGRREEALQEVVQRYADQLTELCRKAPENWFNFFDFWRTP